MKRLIKNHLMNIPGWRTHRKIVVIESDDWGSIRMPSQKVYQNLLKQGIRVDNCPFNRYDSLASEEDLSALFDVLTKYKDKNELYPVFTANCLVANPNFHQIKEKFFSQYYFELFIDTLKHYPKHYKSFELWQEGFRKKIFFPQFHGREHLNVINWLDMLKIGSKETILAFNNNLFGISTSITTETRKSYLAALDFKDISELKFHKEMLEEGLDLFNTIFGFTSNSFIAPNYTWHPEIEPVLANKGVTYIQGNINQKYPKNSSYKIKRHYLGQKNKSGQIYLIRNCFFEPALNEHYDWVNSCLNEINNSFFWKKPAIISTHRLNYIGFIDEANRNRNLKLLNILLSKIIKTWSDVEFLNTSQLGNLITSKQE